MTLQNILHKLREIAQTKPNINFVGDVNVYDLNQKSDAEYSVFWMTPQGTDVYENLINHKLTLFYIDRLTDDWDNQRQIQSDGIRAINNIIKPRMTYKSEYVKADINIISNYYYDNKYNARKSDRKQK